MVRAGGQYRVVQIDPVSPDRLVEIVADLPPEGVRVRLAIDGPPPAGPVELAERVAARLRERGRAAVVVAAADYLRPASVRLEFGREDPDELLHRWLDEAGLRREVLVPGAPGGSGRVLPRLWDAAADRAYRDRYVDLPPDGVILVAGALMLGRGLPFDVTVHLRMSPAARQRTLPTDEQWTLPAYTHYEVENDLDDGPDLVVLADHPTRPAVRRP